MEERVSPFDTLWKRVLCVLILVLLVLIDCVEVEAEAQAEQMRRIARGEADSILLKKQAEANGMKEILLI